MQSRASRWRNELVLSVPQLDDQHRELLEFANDLRATVEAGSPRSEVEHLLTGLVHAVESHFTGEEDLMLARGYAAYGEHRDEHNKLLDQLHLVEKDLASGTIDPCGALALFVEVWTEQHILGPDKHLAAFLGEPAPVGSPERR